MQASDSIQSHSSEESKNERQIILQLMKQKDSIEAEIKANAAYLESVFSALIHCNSYYTFH